MNGVKAAPLTEGKNDMTQCLIGQLMKIYFIIMLQHVIRTTMAKPFSFGRICLFHVVESGSTY